MLGVPHRVHSMPFNWYAVEPVPTLQTRKIFLSSVPLLVVSWTKMPLSCATVSTLPRYVTDTKPTTITAKIFQNIPTSLTGQMSCILRQTDYQLWTPAATCEWQPRPEHNDSHFPLSTQFWNYKMTNVTASRLGDWTYDISKWQTKRWWPCSIKL